MEKYQNSKFIFVVGIGGSDLASKAIWNALTLHKIDENKPASSAGKKIFFLESPDSREYEEVKNFVKNKIINLEEFVLIATSKSGKTAETLEAFHKTFDILSEKFGSSTNERVIVISSPETPLWKLAEENRMEKLAWEGNVGGRFSAFTVAHITILSIAGLDADAYVAGGKEMNEKCNGKMEDNPAVHLAKNIFDSYKKGVDILDFFIFNSELEDLGKWCRQLIAESLGKENKGGEEVGITPTVSIGPTDLHSMLQLDLGGPKNKFTLFIRSLEEINGSVNESAYENVVKAYEDKGLPFEKYEMPKINEYELGKFMALMMTTTVELAKLLEVNPYNQPAVDEYKKHLIDND
jgi:glucose-6-phosphate isomerase